MNKVVFISVDNNHELYKRCVLDNPFVKNNKNITCVSFDNTKENKFISIQYNEFLNNYNFDDEAWFVFCHNDWEILEDIEPKLEKANKNVIYGPIGAVLYKNGKNSFAREFVGACYERKRDSSNLRLQKSYLTKTGTTADILDAQCQIIHSSIFKKYGLRFDEKCEYDMYVEDFNLNAKINFGICINILEIKCCHWSQVDTLNDRSWYFDMLKYTKNKWGKYEESAILNYEGDAKFLIEHVPPQIISTRDTIYKCDVGQGNDSRRYAINYIRDNSSVLDVGCACGDFGVALKKEKTCKIYGLEYFKNSIRIAKETKAYEDVFQIDLNNFEIDNFKNFLKKFDYIVLGDVLEHLINPCDVLEKLKQYLKDGGEFLISFPNISHASIKMNLLVDDFEYTQTGLLDVTHLKFFTQKTISKFLAKLNLEISDMKYTVQNIEGLQPNFPWFSLPKSTRNFIAENPHSYVLQYVVKAKIAENKLYSQLLFENRKKMIIIKNKFLINAQARAFKKTKINNLFYLKMKYFIYKNIIRTPEKALKYKKLLNG